MRIFSGTSLLIVGLFSQSVYSIEIYNRNDAKIHLNGKIEAIYGYRDLKKKINKNDNEDKTFARIAVLGESKINSQTTGYAKFEHQYKHNQRDSTRFAYIGFNMHKLGSLDFGRNTGIISYIKDITKKPAARFGGGGFQGGNNQFMTGMASSLLTYKSPDTFGLIEGLDFYLQGQAKNDAKNGFQKGVHGNGIATALLYKNSQNGLGAGLTYGLSHRLESQKACLIDNFHQRICNQKNHADFIGVGASLNINAIYLAASFSNAQSMFLVNNQKEYARKTQGLELIGTYTFNNSITPTLHYNQQKAKGLKYNAISHSHNSHSFDTYLNKYIALGVKYNLNKQMQTAMGYKFNLLNKKNRFVQEAKLNSDNEFEIKLSYAF